MNEKHKKIIENRSTELQDIIPTEQLFAALCQSKIFDRSLIEHIKVEKTQSDQICKLLSMLPKRGPDAFYRFIDVIRHSHDWLAKMLEKDDDGDPDDLPKQVNVEAHADTDIKDKVNAFLHKQFGQSKKISHQDKKAMEKWMQEQLSTERKNKAGKSNNDNFEDSGVCGCFNPDQIYDALEALYLNMKGAIIEHQWYNEQPKKPTDDEQNSNIYDSDTANTRADNCTSVISKLAEEIETLFSKTNQMEKCLRQCHEMLNDPDMKHDLSNLIKDAQITNIEKMKQEMEQEKKKLLEQQKKEKDKYDSTVQELYNFSTSISKLESHRAQLRYQIEQLSAENNSLKQNIMDLNEKYTALEETNLRHLEKEKTIQDLKKLIEALQSRPTGITDENANYSSDFVIKRNQRRQVNKTGSVANTVTIIKNSPRKFVQKTVPKTNKRKGTKTYQ